MTKPDLIQPDTPLIELRGVGSERQAQLARLKLETVRDLLHHVPRRHEDRRHISSIASLELNENATARGKIIALGLKSFARRSGSLFEIILDDGSARLHCRWWNLPYMQKYFQQGDEVLVYGKVNSVRPRMIDHPESEIIDAGDEMPIHLNRIAPIYPLTEGLPQRFIRSLIWHTLRAVSPEGFSSSDALVMEETLPPVERVAFPEKPGADERALPLASGEASPALPPPQFPAYFQALSQLHFPAEMREVEVARKRLALEEMLGIQTAIRERRRKMQSKARSLPCGGDNRLIKPFLASLGFRLTDSQTCVLREIRADLASGQPMRRLLQGDVGSGKTVVAACAVLMALESGCSAALMAPTEILASQHFHNFRRWLEPLGISVFLHTGSVKSKETSAQAALPLGSAPRAGACVAVGTHALIESGFEMEKLGLVVIDEQHKFGVAQREKLLRKGRYPHLLVMTATPIPRTLGLTLYGDLDMSTITELPGGRRPIRTFVRTPEQLTKVWAFMRDSIAAGRQAYVVYPRLEEGGAKSLKSVAREWESVRNSLAPWKVEMAHGKLSSEEKERVMRDFRENKIQVLMATSVIEVGVDVPNATLMLVEDAEQFGLAQLHQLRGRIGRGQHESYCILVASAGRPSALQRLEILAATTDGFRIAEEDLKLRGPGDFLGQDQSGAAPFKFANLAEDFALVEKARQLAEKIAG